LKRLHDFLFISRAVLTYPETRNQLDGPNFSSKLSPWLANGSLSVRLVYHEARRFEREEGTEDLAKLFIIHLYVRDFCLFWSLYHGNKIFFEYGATN